MYILDSDQEIKTSFSKWINDSMVYEKQVLDIFSKYNNEISRNRLGSNKNS
jgi:hypothetical protein